MKLATVIPFILISALLVLNFACSANQGKILTRLKVDTSIVSIAVPENGQGYSVGGVLEIPRAFESEALVIIIHGSNGLDSRGQFHKRSLHKAGIATLELDLWASRGWLDGSFSRPTTVHETLPDVFAALRYVAQLPQFDAEKIGILGFSWGGAVAMLSREETIVNSISPLYQFSAHVAFYPVCWGYSVIPIYNIATTTQQPILILTGEYDDYDLPSSCNDWKQSLSASEQKLVTVKVYKGAFHAFNSFEKERIVQDPFSHLGKGGSVLMKPQPKARKKSKRDVVRFFKEQFNLD